MQTKDGAENSIYSVSNSSAFSQCYGNRKTSLCIFSSVSPSELGDSSLYVGHLERKERLRIQPA